MDISKKIFDPAKNQKKGMNLWFFLTVMLSSNIRTIIYVFHVCHLIDLRSIDQSELTEEYLLQSILKLCGDEKIIKKGHLREITGLNKDTFNDYFDDHLKEIDLYNRRIFTIKETYQILNFWQGDHQWERMEAYTKGELAKHFTQSNYENLAIDMIDNSIFTEQEYQSRHYIKPADVKKFIVNSIENKRISLNPHDTIYEKSYYSLKVFFHLYIVKEYFI